MNPAQFLAWGGGGGGGPGGGTRESLRNGSVKVHSMFHKYVIKLVSLLHSVTS